MLSVFGGVMNTLTHVCGGVFLAAEMPVHPRTQVRQSSADDIKGIVLGISWTADRRPKLECPKPIYKEIVMAIVDQLREQHPLSLCHHPE